MSGHVFVIADSFAQRMSHSPDSEPGPEPDPIVAGLSADESSAALERIREVIRDTVKPSSVGSVPLNFGDAAAGTPKTDEWRTMYRLYLALALVSLWGEGTLHISDSVADKLRAILDHTMALVSAIAIVCARTVTVERAVAYRSYIATWVRDLTTLHPHMNHVGNHHMAFHIYDFLLSFGPVHSWWALAVGLVNV